MNKINLQPLKGFRDFLPEEVRKRTWLRQQMVTVFEKWVYEPIETPTLELAELFTGQVGEDEKLFYKFVDNGGRNVMLRYDQTVPTCRFVAQNLDKIQLPFKRYQIQSNFRAENPQKGRYREFTQADIDIFGIESPIADAECIAVSIDLYKSLGFSNVIALINNRDLLSGIPYPVIAAIDKIKKLGKDGVIKEIISKGYSQEDADEFLTKVENLLPDEKLNTIFNYLEEIGITKENYRFEPTLARSFSYSEGPIWEIAIPQYSTASFGGSVGGGERYDGMMEKITGLKIPGTGIAFGFDRTLEALESLDLLPKFENVTKVLITVFSKELFNNSLKLSLLLRSKGISCELYPDANAKLDKQLKYADKKGIPYVIIIGPDEINNNEVALKNLKGKSQEKINIDQLIKRFT